MHTLIVSLKVPFRTENTVGPSQLTFNRWLPLEKPTIRVIEQNFELSLWFELQSTWWASQPTEQELSHQVNVLARYINAEIKTSGVSTDLAEYMQQRAHANEPVREQRFLQDEYEKLGRQMLDLLLNKVNRLTSFVRAFKGQYWLIELTHNIEDVFTYYEVFEALGSIDEGQYFPFQPASSQSLGHLEIPSEMRYINKSDWERVKDFVHSNNKTPLVGTLLATAEQLAANGHRRSALTEAITALEIAISEFARNPDISRVLPHLPQQRIAWSDLPKQVEHIGLSGTVRYLLPMILPSTLLSDELLLNCQSAITERQNVVHQGQRNVDAGKVRRFLFSIRQCCEVLRSLTRDEFHSEETPHTH